MTDRWNIHTGDSGAVLSTLGRIDLVVTDPPYASSSQRARRPEWAISGGVLRVVAEAASRAKEMIILCPSSGGVLRFIDVVRPFLPLARVMPWIKPFTATVGIAGPFGWQTVLALWFGRCGGAMRVPDHIIAGTRARVANGTSAHPAEMPLEVGAWLVEGLRDRLTPETRVVDPFIGTGALLWPFYLAGCECHGIEIDPGHAALARQRFLEGGHLLSRTNVDGSRQADMIGAV